MTDYEVLGLSSSATLEEIKKRFHQLVKMNHPDKYDREADLDLWNLANERMTQITEAYRRLSDNAIRGEGVGQRAGGCGESNSRKETEVRQRDEDERRRQVEANAKNDLVRKQKIERYIDNLKNGYSSYEDIHDLIPNWLFYHLQNLSSPFKKVRIASDDEVVELIVNWVHRAVIANGAYTFNAPAILTLERIEGGLEFHISDFIMGKVKSCLNEVAKVFADVDAKYGKVERTSAKSHYVKKLMKDKGLKIGLSGENEMIDYCKYCRHCCYTQKFLHKVWSCRHRTGTGENSVEIKVDPSVNCCMRFERRYPLPSSLSKRRLMQYGIIQYALSLGYCYVNGNDIEAFGVCRDCKYYTSPHRHRDEECALRGKGTGHSADTWCCKSFVPRFPEFYIKLS